LSNAVWLCWAFIFILERQNNMNLIVASKKGDLRSVREAIARGEDINHREINNVGTALFATIEQNHLQARGDGYSDTPLIAVIRNHVHAIRLLLHFGANIQWCPNRNNKYPRWCPG
jgi:hypothetical protein